MSGWSQLLIRNKFVALILKWVSKKGNEIRIVAYKSLRNKWEEINKKKVESVIFRNVFNTKWVGKKIIN